MKADFSMPGTRLRCIGKGCGYTTGLLEERKFSCPQCGSLFDVEHDYEKIPFNAFTERFDLRAKNTFVALNKNRMDHSRSAFFPEMVSGVWRFREWIMPHLGNEHIVTLGEGNVPIVAAGKHLSKWLGPVDAWLIMEGSTPTGSFKDFGGTVMISIAKAAGIKKDGCASTGDTSAMGAAYSVAGIECSVILPKDGITPTQLAQPLVHGAKVITLPGTFDDCMRVVKELVNCGKMFPINSLNPTRIEGHQATVFLLAQFFGWELPNWIALPVGNGSNCSSVGKAMRLMKQLGFKRDTSRILGCQSESANPLARSWLQASLGQEKTSIERWLEHYKPLTVGKTNATAANIGNPVSRDKVMREIVAADGAMNTVPESMLNEAVAVCGRDGYFVCPQTGTALAGIKLAIADGTIAKGSSVAVVSTATGLKFTESAAAGLMKKIVPAKDCQTKTVAALLGL